jgi:hypothetical protein
MIYLFHDGFADDFDDLRDDGVAKTGESVNPVGNPISHSTNFG